MSELPPPTGKPVAYALTRDPWAEQARRHEAHRAERRRRRGRVLRWATGGLGLGAVLAGAAYVVFVDSGDRADGTASTDTERVASTEGVAIVIESSAPDAPSDDTAQVLDVWLLDRGDGSFGWGAVLGSNAEIVREELEVSMTALDADGSEVVGEELIVAQLAPGGSAAVGGVFEAEEATPVRLEVTATLGVAQPDEVGAAFDVVDVRRVTSGQVGRADRLLGTVELIAGDGGPVHLAAIWRDDDGGVIASVFDVLEPVEPGAPVDFSLRLPRNLVPSGDPDTIVISLSEAG